MLIKKQQHYRMSDLMHRNFLLCRDKFSIIFFGGTESWRSDSRDLVVTFIGSYRHNCNCVYLSRAELSDADSGLGRSLRKSCNNAWALYDCVWFAPVRLRKNGLSVCVSELQNYNYKMDEELVTCSPSCLCYQSNVKQSIKSHAHTWVALHTRLSYTSVYSQ
jgi:hypothetical protein